MHTKNSRDKFVIRGLLAGHAETGTEGTHWVLEETPIRGYEGLHFVENGDHLTVFTPEGPILWQGFIDLEYVTGYQPYPLNPRFGQQCALGRWVHGNQRGFAIEDWAEMFLAGEVENSRYGQQLDGVLIESPQRRCAVYYAVGDEILLGTIEDIAEIPQSGDVLVLPAGDRLRNLPESLECDHTVSYQVTAVTRYHTQDSGSDAIDQVLADRSWAESDPARNREFWTFDWYGLLGIAGADSCLPAPGTAVIADLAVNDKENE